MNACRDDDADEGDDWDDEDTDGGDDSDDEPTVPCPYCRREILEDAPRCPYCEQYISAADHGSSKKPLWVIVTARACLAATLCWLLAWPG